MKTTSASPRSLVVAASAATVMAFAFLSNWLWGSRLIGYDVGYELATVTIEGGYRAYLGQAAFVDFIAPVGPLLFWMLGAFFKVFGLSYSSCLTLGGAMNSAAAGIVFWAGLRQNGEPRSRPADLGPAVGAAILTAVWYMPLSNGVPVYTSGAFFFVIVAAALLSGRRQSPGGLATLLAGTSLAAAFSVKQPVGIFAAYFMTLHVLAADSDRAAAWRDASRLAGGFVLGLIILALAIGPEGWNVAWRHVVILPLFGGGGAVEQYVSSRAAIRLSLAGLALAAALRQGERPLMASAAALLCVHLATGGGARPDSSVFTFLPLAALPVMDRPGDRTMMIALTLTGYCSAIFASSPLGHHLPLIGLQYFLFARAWKRWGSDPIRRPWQRILAGDSPLTRGIPVWGTLAFLAVLGTRQIALTRWGGWIHVPAVKPFLGLAAVWLGTRVLSFHRDAEAGKGRGPVAIGLSSLIAGLALLVSSAATGLAIPRALEARGSVAPANVPFFRGFTMPPEDARTLDAVYERLAGLPPEAKPFFIIGRWHWLALYAALGQAQPQPFVWFDAGLTHSGPIDDAKIREALDRAGVATVAVEGKVHGPQEDEFAGLSRYLAEGFEPDQRIGLWTFYRRKAGGK